MTHTYTLYGGETVDDKKKSTETKEKQPMQKITPKTAKPEIKDIDDLIFEEEYIKRHSEK